MIRYAAFAGADYYPAGGWEDFVAVGGSVAELLPLIRARLTVQGNNTGDWWHVVDLTTNEIVQKGEEKP